MSIYCSIFGFGDEHGRKCRRIKKVSNGVYEQDDSKPCTCESCPIEYQGSHVFPSKSDKHDGDFGFAAIPYHITRDGRDNRPEKGEWAPWLRVHMNRETVVITKKQAKEFRDALTDWLTRAH